MDSRPATGAKGNEDLFVLDSFSKKGIWVGEEEQRQAQQLRAKPENINRISRSHERVSEYFIQHSAPNVTATMKPVVSFCTLWLVPLHQSA